MSVSEIYTDGSCIGNPGPGGWAALIRQNGGERMLTGGDAATTNNRMELMAAIMALEALPAGDAATLYTDSMYVRSGITSWIVGWKRKGWRGTKGAIKNVDLWQRLDGLNAARVIDWRWVRGHCGHPDNERVDAAANAAAENAAAGAGNKIMTPFGRLTLGSYDVEEMDTESRETVVRGLRAAMRRMDHAGW